MEQKHELIVLHNSPYQNLCDHKLNNSQFLKTDHEAIIAQNI